MKPDVCGKTRHYRMSPVIRTWLILSLALTLAGPIGVSQAGATDFIPGELLVGWDPASASLPPAAKSPGFAEERTASDWQAVTRALSARTGLAVLEAYPAHGAARLAVAPGLEEQEAARLRSLPWVRYAEPNYIAHAAALPDAPLYPNDPYFGDQWYMRRIAAPEAWSLTLGSYSFIVAIVDSGIDRTHPEFANRLLPGYDYVSNDTDPNDDFGHGTHVTGLLAAAIDNRAGIAGLAPRVSILPLKVLDRYGAGSYNNIAVAIERAADAGAQVINLSLGGLSTSQRLQIAVEYAQARNVLLVAAAGNCAQGGVACDSRTNPDFYPAAFPNVLTVAASDHFDNWATYSGYKPYVGIAAPGGVEQDRIWSTTPGGYGFKHGTSMSTALVSAAAALIWTLQPAATYTQIADILKNTAEKVGVNPTTGQTLTYTGGRNDYFGYGRLNVGRAVLWAYPPSLNPISEVQEFLLGGPITQQTRSLSLANPSEQAVWWQATVTAGSNWLKASPATGTANSLGPGTLDLQAVPALLPAGIYTGTVRIRSLFPEGVPGFDIAARLHVNESAGRAYVPGLGNGRRAADWLDPLAGGLSGQALYLTDNTVRTLSLPFPVTFYGTTHSYITVSDNGLVGMGQQVASAVPVPSGCLQTAALPNNAIYVLAQDWHPDLGGQVYVHQPDANTYVVTWLNVRGAASSTPQSFQLVFRQNGEISAFYLNVEGPVSGVVGIENYDGTVAQQLRCAGTGLAILSGDTVVFDPRLPW